MKAKYNFDKFNYSHIPEENVTVDLCGLLSKLNLNFLKKGKNIGHSKFLQDEKADVYNSSLLESFYKNSTNFLQSFYSKNYKNRKIRPGKFLLLLLRFFI